MVTASPLGFVLPLLMVPTVPPMVLSHNDRSASCIAVNSVEALAPNLTLLILV